MVDITQFAPFPFNLVLFGVELNLTGLVMRLAITVGFILLTKFVLALIKPAFKWMDDAVDVVHVIDLPKEMNDTIIKTIEYLTIAVSAFYVFLVWGVENPLENTVFQLIALFLVTKLTLGVRKHFIKGMDDMFPQYALSRHQQKLMEKAIKYSVYVGFLIGFIYILGFTDIFFAAIAGFGVAGLAVGFAAKDTISNVFGGMAILLDKPFKVGDTIEIMSFAGVVEEIAMRSTTIKMFDNKTVIMPNKLMANKPIINYSREKVRRVAITVGVAYDTELEYAINVIKKAIAKVDGVVTDTKSIDVLISQFGASSIDLEVRVWIETKKGLNSVKTKATEAMKIALDAADIEIPFPVRVMMSPKKPKSARKKASKSEKK